MIVHTAYNPASKVYSLYKFEQFTWKNIVISELFELTFFFIIMNFNLSRNEIKEGEITT